MGYRRIAILGCGLIGGSFALGLKKNGYTGTIVAWDRGEVLAKARERGAIDEGTASVGEAVTEADLIYLATPVGLILELLERIGQCVKPGALVADAGSTKAHVCALAGQVLPDGVLFLGGHPMAGKETGGIENASADLFVGQKYLLIRQPSTGDEDKDLPREPVKEFIDWVRRLGAEPAFLDAVTHDWAVAFVSQLPQLLSTALAGVVMEETNDNGLPLHLAGRGFREMTRLAASPFDIWRDICLTNSDNLERALERMEKQLAYLRTHLRSSDLAQAFEMARRTGATLDSTGASRGGIGPRGL